jgi:hypothetical protein
MFKTCKIQMTAVLVGAFFHGAVALAGASSSYDAMEAKFAQELYNRVENASLLQVDSSGEGQEWKFSRFQILTGAFAEFDLKVIELKVHPYVELRFNRK